jgi:hypothetical protein
MSLTVKRPSTKGSTFQVATPPVPSTCMLTRAPGLYSDSSALVLKPSYVAQPNAQRRTSLDHMCVHHLHLPTALASRSALALKEPGQWRVGHNYPRGGSQGRRPRAFVSAKLARSHPCQQAACFLPCSRPPDFVVSRCSFTIFATAPKDSSTLAVSAVGVSQCPCPEGPVIGCSKLIGDSLCRVPANLPVRHVLEGPHHLCYRPSRHLLRRATTRSKACTSCMTDLLLLRNFSTLYSLFSCLMFSHTSSFFGTYSICVHHPSMFCAYHLSHPFSSCVFLAYFSLLSFYVHP